MHMIRHTADAVQLAAQMVHNTHHKCVEVALMLLRDGPLTTMRADNDMIHSGCVAHADSNDCRAILLYEVACLRHARGLCGR